MFSIVVVYNNERTLNEILLQSLKNQTVEFELIAIDNTKGRFQSAAEALNYGGEQAKGKYIMFVHQDVELDSSSWLEEAENLLDNIPDLGIAGVAGMSENGKDNRERGRGYISDCGEIWHWSNVIQKPEQVQTLDEYLLIVPRLVFNELQFDEKTFDGWHCYSPDYCLSVKQIGLKPYVIPAFVYHRSLRFNVQDLLEYQKKLYNKHKKSYRHIYTTMGEISWIRLKLRSYIEVFMPIYLRVFPSWTEYLKRELSECNTVLDLGCGYNSPLQLCNVPFSVGVELFDPYLLESKKKGIHNEYIKADITKIEFKPESFDAIIALEVAEHLTKQEGHELLGKMERWAKKKILMTTPNGYLWQDGYDNNPLQEHRTGWNPGELKRLGFKVYGINGWKKLRGYKGEITYKPAFLWARISDLTQKITYRFPDLAFQLFAVKHIEKSGRE